MPKRVRVVVWPQCYFILIFPGVAVTCFSSLSPLLSSMITVVTEDDRTFPMDVDVSIELENLKALIEADSSIAAADQQLMYRGAILADEQATLASLGVQNDDILLLRNSRHSQQQQQRVGQAGGSASGSQAASSEEQWSEQIRQQILNDPNTLAMLRANNPDMAEAATKSPARFLQLLQAQRDRMGISAGASASGPSGNEDEFDIDAQRRIEEAIRQERVLENLEHAMEYTPESFGRVTMLYVDCKVNGTDVKAFVDSGAQATIMSPECAQRCGIMRLLDTRFAGIARGVGTAKILGRVHSAQLQLGTNIFLPCSFTIMENKGVEMLFGLDMLKRYQASIDLSQNALVINGSSIRFLDEHQLPAEASAEYELDEHGNPKPVSQPPPTSTLGQASANANAAAAANATKFPGTGSSLANPPAQPAPNRQLSDSHGWSFSHPPASAQAAAQPTAAPPQSASSKWPASSIQSIVDLGASHTQAVALLDAANGNVEVAASLLFQQ